MAEASPPADHALEEGATFELGPHRFAVLHVPGHSPGSICLLDDANGTIFTGDAIYVDARLGWDDPAAFATSLLRLRGLDIRVVHSGHGRSFDGAELRTAVDAALRELG